MTTTPTPVSDLVEWLEARRDDQDALDAAEWIGTRIPEIVRQAFIEGATDGRKAAMNTEPWDYDQAWNESSARAAIQSGEEKR